jgi:hypothetical protein
MSGSRSPLGRAAAVAVVTIGLVACSPNSTSKSTTGSNAKLDTSVSTVKPLSSANVGATEVPEEFPKDSIPLPDGTLVGVISNTEGTGKHFDFSYAGPDLQALVASAKAKLTAAGFTVSGEYDQKVRNVPSAGFVATSDKWLVTVGGQVGTDGKAGLNVSVASV